MPAPLSVAIVGAGPAGFYTAEALADRDHHCRIDLIERLPTPYGLIRAGVAPDHQAVKQIERRFARTATRTEIRYFGNVTVGRDVSFDELRGMYDAVVLAVGAPVDRYLGIPGENKRGVYGSALFVGWYNGHPGFRDLNPPLDTPAAVVVGIGNVALDVARILVKTEEELADSDIADPAATILRGSRIRDVTILGRRGPLDARFTIGELREMGGLDQATPLADPADLADAVPDSHPDRRHKDKILRVLGDYARRDEPDKPRRVCFRFFAAPTALLGGERVEAVRIERTQVRDGRLAGTGRFEEIPCGLVISAVGYRGEPIPGVPFDASEGRVVNDGGRVAPGVYAVGWAKRGPTGVIGSNRPDGQRCADQLTADFKDFVSSDRTADGRAGRDALVNLLTARGVRAVSFEDWLKIDAAERAAAEGRQPRRKFTRLSEMLAVLDR